MVDGIAITRKRQPEEQVLDEEKMKELMDWMWRTRHNKLGDEDKRWAPAAEIPKHLRPKHSADAIRLGKHESISWMGTCSGSGMFWVEVQINDRRGTRSLQCWCWQIQEPQIHEKIQ